MSKHHIGRCGNCGGDVTIPRDWMGINPPIPTCEKCGSTAAPKGPVIDMNPRPQRGSTGRVWRP